MAAIKEKLATTENVKFLFINFLRKSKRFIKENARHVFDYLSINVNIKINGLNLNLLKTS